MNERAERGQDLSWENAAMPPNVEDDDPRAAMSPTTVGLLHEGDITGSPITDMVEQPAKVMRIGTMIKQLLEEVRSAPLDAAARAHLREIHARSITELEDGLAPELVAELERLTLPIGEGDMPSDSELRIAQAQLVGWLEGLFHGIQTALFAQQMAARAQFEEMRRRAALAGREDADAQAGLAVGLEQTGNPPPPHGPYL